MSTVAASGASEAAEHAPVLALTAAPIGRTQSDGAAGLDNLDETASRRGGSDDILGIIDGILGIADDADGASHEAAWALPGEDGHGGAR